MRTRRSRSQVRWALALALAGVSAGLLTDPAHGQRRKVQRIERPPEAAPTEAVASPAGELPTPAECVASARAIAAAYGPDELGPWLHPQFPNREEVLDALARADHQVSSLELRVESVEGVEIGPWRPETGPRRRGKGSVTWVSDCVVDLRTLLVYDDPSSGQRSQQIGRGEWRIRFSRDVAP